MYMTEQEVIVVVAFVAMFAHGVFHVCVNIYKEIPNIYIIKIVAVCNKCECNQCNQVT